MLKKAMPLALVAVIVALIVSRAPAARAQEATEGAEQVGLRMSALMAAPVPLSKSTREIPVAISIGRGKLRVEFNDEHGRGILLLDAHGDGVRVDPATQVAVPVSTRSFTSLVVDPRTPCAAMMVRCDRIADRRLAGSNAHGWRYRGAQGRGPAGTSDGEFWIEPDTGLVLAFRGRRTGLSQLHELQAADWSQQLLPLTLFEPGASVTLLPSAKDRTKPAH